MIPVLELIDRALADRALVYGSLPPDARDIDLLVRPPEEAALAAALTDAGFLRRDDIWARFTRCSVDVVELTAARSWSLPASEVEALFAEARPLEGRAHLVRPAPHHVLLILARRAAATRGRLDAVRNRRLAQAVGEDPEAWSVASARAAAGRAREHLDRLKATHRDGAGPAAPSRRPRRRRSRGAVIALSGIDGAGKSLQAAALRDTLQRLGYDATVVWTRLMWDDALWRVALPIKRTLARALSAAPRVDADDPVRELREGSRELTHAWAMVVSLVNAISQRRLTRGARRGRIVICDRYTLDSVVALRYAYGRHARFRPQRALIAALCPAPRRAYLLDVPAEKAYARKGEYGVEWLAVHRMLYREEHVGLGVRLLDAERPAEDVCAEIALDVWQSGL